MRTVKKEITVYKYNELPDESKRKALEKHWGINVDFNWWEGIEEELQYIGLKMDSFGLDRDNHCNLQFVESSYEVANRIIADHGKETDTHKAAKTFFDDDDEEEFKRSLEEEYRILLQSEYEYLVSREAIEETFEANEYEFDEHGDIFLEK